MEIRERILAAFRREKLDKIPWVIWDVLLAKSQAEHEARNSGLGLMAMKYMHDTWMPDVSREEKPVEGGFRMFYHTPVGSISTVFKTGVGYEDEVWPPATESMIKDVADYDVLKFFFENQTYSPNYERFRNSERRLGNDGVTVALAPRSPLQRLLMDGRFNEPIMNVARLSWDLYANLGKLEEIMGLIDKKTDEVYRIIADSPAEIVYCSDNIDGVITNPRLFKKYCIPFYKKHIRLLHSKGKIFLVHMDGRLKSLAELIGESGIDAIDSFNPPPMGDLSISEARETWGDKITLVANVPPPICLEGKDEVKKHLIKMLKEAAPGDGFILGMQENIPEDVLPASLSAMAEVMTKARYPISLD